MRFGSNHIKYRDFARSNKCREKHGREILYTNKKYLKAKVAYYTTVEVYGRHKNKR